jgi:hypothetical protein
VLVWVISIVAFVVLNPILWQRFVLNV